jgi:hypothetical protein
MYINLFQHSESGDNLRGFGVDVMIKLKHILKIQNLQFWAGLTCLRTVYIGKFFLEG